VEVIEEDSGKKLEAADVAKDATGDDDEQKKPARSLPYQTLQTRDYKYLKFLKPLSSKPML
jgi:hypothetical protein